jgi:hypothetical protein
MYNVETGEEVATYELLGIHLARVNRKSCTFPDDLKSKFEKLVVSD